MRWIRFSAGSHTAYGIVENDRIAEVKGDPFDGYERTETHHALASVKIELVASVIFPPLYFHW